MHELAMMTDLMRQIQTVATQERANAVVAVKVRLGALSHVTPSHFREHFEDAARGGLAAGAKVDVEVSSDLDDPHARDVVLQEVEIT